MKNFLYNCYWARYYAEVLQWNNEANGWFWDSYIHKNCEAFLIDPYLPGSPKRGWEFKVKRIRGYVAVKPLHENPRPSRLTRK